MKGIGLLCFVTFVVRSTLAFVSPLSVGHSNNNNNIDINIDIASTPRSKAARSSQFGRLAPSGFLHQATVHTNTRLLAEPSSSGEREGKSKLPFFLDPGTKGGALFLSLILFVIPIIFYNIILAVSSDIDELDLGRWIGVGFTAVATVGWLGTYLFRVVTKDMTYVSFMT